MVPDHVSVAVVSAILGAALRPVFDDIYSVAKQRLRKWWEGFTLWHLVRKIPVYGHWRKRKREKRIDDLVESLDLELDEEA